MEKVKRKRSNENNNPQKKKKSNLLDYFSSSKKKDQKKIEETKNQEIVIVVEEEKPPLPIKNVFPIFLSPSQVKDLKEQEKLEKLEKEIREKEELVKNFTNRDHPLLKKRDNVSFSTVKYVTEKEWGFGEPIHIFEKKNEETMIEKTNLDLLELVDIKDDHTQPLEKFKIKKMQFLNERKRREIDLTIGPSNITQLTQTINQNFNVNLNATRYLMLFDQIKENSNDLWIDLNKTLFCGNSRELKTLENYLEFSKQGESLLIHGLSGTGKTQLVYMISFKLGYEVFEINSSMERDGASMQNKFGEISQSHHVKMKKDKVVILFDDIDQGEISISSLRKIMLESKQPIVFTSETSKLFRNETISLIDISLKNNINSECILDRVLLIYTILVSKSINLCYIEILSLVLYFNGDIRKILMNLQFWNHENFVLEKILGIDSVLDRKEFVEDVEKDIYLDLYFNNYEMESIQNISKYVDTISELDTLKTDDLNMLKSIKLCNNTNIIENTIKLPSGFNITNPNLMKSFYDKRDKLITISKKVSLNYDYKLVDFLFYLCKVEEEKKLVKRRHFHYLKNVLGEVEIDFINKYKV